MFKRLSPAARRAVALAQEECSQLCHARVSSQHLLVGVASVGADPVTAVLSDLGVSATSIRDEVRRQVGRRPRPLAATPPFSYWARLAVARADAEADRLGSQAVEPRHLLLALVAEPGATSHQVLVALGVEPAELRRLIVQQIAASPNYPGASRPALRSGLIRSSGAPASSPDPRPAAGPLGLDDRQRRMQWMAVRRDVPALVDDLERLLAENERLRQRLRQHGVDPDAGERRAAGS